ncbi:MAG TPA: glutathione transferase GstA [Steroidobacteraceae bacterium]|nr:glutathione transferase GstA [Steroidobacteraceae bacterium]
MLLYYYPGACSLAPHIVLLEAGIPHEIKKVDLQSKQVEGGGDFSKVSSKGYVPALRLDSGAVLTEGPAIMQYLADQRPQSGLLPPPGSLERYRVIEWLSFIGSEIHKPFGAQFAPVAPEWKAGTLAQLKGRLAWTHGELAQKSYLVGERFSIADAYLFVVLGWAPHIGLDLGPWPALGAYLQRLASRPKVQEALKAEGLV